MKMSEFFCELCRPERPPMHSNEHWQAMRNNTVKSAYIDHILNIGNSFRNLTDTQRSAQRVKT